MSVIEIATCLAAGVVGGLIVFITTKRDVTNEEFDRMRDWVSVAVEAAEKLMEDKTGEEKRVYAGAVLDAVKINIEDIEARAMLEAVVYELEQDSFELEIDEDTAQRTDDDAQPPLAVDNY